MKLITLDEAEDVKKAISPIRKICIWTRKKTTGSYQETFAMDLVLEFLEILPDIVKKLSEEDIENI